MKRIILIALIATIGLSELSGFFPSTNNLVSYAAEKTNDVVEQPQSRTEQEAKILASTVRIQMHGWTELGGHLFEIKRGGKSHGTIIDGRHLITHNHFANPFTAQEQGGYTGMTLYDSNGKLLVENISLDYIEVVDESSQTLVIEVTDALGKGLFESLDLQAAETKTHEELSLRAGMEVAQIDWDGASTHIEWAIIDEVIMNEGTSRVILDNYVEKGASGGGIFLDGYHIANNWSRLRDRNIESGTITREYTKVALNTQMSVFETLVPTNS